VDAVVAPFAASLTEMIRVWGSSLDGSSALDADPWESKRSFLTELYNGLAPNRGIVRTLIAAEAADDEDPILLDARSRLREVFAGLAEVSRSVGARRGVTPFEPELTARVVIAMMVAVTALDDMLFPEGPPEPADLISALTELTAHGRAGIGQDGP
jgi:hypothetical protein